MVEPGICIYSSNRGGTVNTKTCASKENNFCAINFYLLPSKCGMAAVMRHPPSHFYTSPTATPNGKTTFLCNHEVRHPFHIASLADLRTCCCIHCQPCCPTTASTDTTCISPRTPLHGPCCCCSRRYKRQD